MTGVRLRRVTVTADEPLDIKPIEARLAVATPGPWTDVTFEGGIAIMHGTSRGFDGYVMHEDGGDLDTADADFIAHALTDLAACVAEIERDREVIEDLHRRLRIWRGHAAAGRGG